MSIYKTISALIIILALNLIASKQQLYANVTPCSDLGINVTIPTPIVAGEPFEFTASGSGLRPGTTVAIEVSKDLPNEVSSIVDRIERQVGSSQTVTFPTRDPLDYNRDNSLDGGHRSVILDLPGYDWIPWEAETGKCAVGTYIIPENEVVVYQCTLNTYGGCFCPCPDGSTQVNDLECVGVAACSDSVCQCKVTDTGDFEAGEARFPCDGIPDPNAKAACIACAGEGYSNNNLWTGLGCITFSPVGFVSDILRLAVGMAGGVTFLFLIFGTLTITTSAGNPEAVAKGKDRITSAIIGLVFVIFSVFLLNLIGVKILEIPGL